MSVRRGVIGFGAVVFACLWVIVAQGCFVAVDYLGSDCPYVNEADCCGCIERGECTDEDQVPRWCADAGTDGGRD